MCMQGWDMGNVELHNMAGLINELHLRIIALEQKLDRIQIEYRLVDLEQKVFSETEKRLKRLEKTSNLHEAAIIKRLMKID